jgi:hypothetical protein
VVAITKLTKRLQIEAQIIRAVWLLETASTMVRLGDKNMGNQNGQKLQSNRKGCNDVGKQKYTPEEKARIEAYKQRERYTVRPIRFKEDGIEGNRVNLRMDCEDQELALVTLLETTGTPHRAFNQAVLIQTTQASCRVKEEAVNVANAVAAAMLDIAPKDALEGMLASQMVAIHNQAIECMRRANIEEQPFDIATSYRNQAIKLVRTYAALVEALKKYRTGGQQKMIVEHVHVSEGGRAIVGTVTQGGGGRNDKKRG